MFDTVLLSVGNHTFDTVLVSVGKRDNVLVSKSIEK